MPANTPPEAAPLLLKDRLFNAQGVRRLALELQAVWPPFPRETFESEVLAAFPELELKARIFCIMRALRTALPPDYRTAVGVILSALPPEADPSQGDNDYGEFIYAPYSEFVSHYGCSAADLDFSLAALRTLTTRFSAEGPIRVFLNAFPDQTLAALQVWSQDRHYHVRRLVSEGTRPRLPWFQKLTLPPEAALPLLDQLHADPTRFVTRSVANHLNDISKREPGWVLEALTRWREAGRQRPEELDYISRHALRTLVKQGHGPTLAFLGYPSTPAVDVGALQITTPQVAIGESLLFQCELVAREATRLVVDYRLDFCTAKGGFSAKVFKLKSISLAAGERLTLSKRHPLRVMTTRRLYPGEHRLTLQLNGQDVARGVFELVPS
ncbi:MAG: DNA alkylation repair protein [Candidatus Sericytochromatia bacterium]